MRSVGTTDSRACSRRTVRFSVAVQGRLGLGHAHTRDVGLGGSFLEIQADNFREGENLNLWFQLPNCAGKNYQIRARVVRRDADGLGVAFQSPSITGFRTLQEIIRAADQGRSFDEV